MKPSLIPCTRGPLSALLAVTLLITGAAGVARAAELYRWSEPDGAITFSPDRPPAGIAFERVDDGVRSPVAPAAPVTGTASDPTVATSDPDAPGKKVAPDPSAIERSPNVELSYAPPPLGAAVTAPAGISAGERRDTTEGAEGVEGVKAAKRAEGVARRSGSAARADTGRSQREERCRELEKRVVSLERRLATRLSPEDMDNTVLYMVRYQENVEQHCRG